MAWQLLLLGVGLSVVGALCVVEVPHGVVIKPQGRARAFTEATEVVVVMRHPEPLTTRALQKAPRICLGCI